MIIPMLCVTIFVILVVWFLLPRVARLMIHTPTAISIFVCLSMVQLRSEERFSRNAETDLVCRLLLEKKNTHVNNKDRESQTIHALDVFSLPFSYAMHLCIFFYYFLFNYTATTEIYTLSLHDALPIYALRDYFRDIGRMVLAAEGRKANDSHADCYQYFCVPEYGTANGRLHFHAVHFMRTLPTGSVDPNFGRRVRNRRQLNSLQNTWPYGYSMPIAVRYTQDAFSRSGWLWPVDAKGEPLKATSY